MTGFYEVEVSKRIPRQNRAILQNSGVLMVD